MEGGRGAVLEHDEAVVEDVGVDQLEVDVRQAGEDRFPPRAAEDLGNTTSLSRSTIPASIRA